MSKQVWSADEADPEREAFESAVARLPFPVFVVDGDEHLRAMNAHAKQLWASEKLHESLLSRFPAHPLSGVIRKLRDGKDDDELPTVTLNESARYEVIHSTRSPKGEKRWLMLMLRPLPSPLAIDIELIRKRWSLTRREAEVAAECVAGRTTDEMSKSLSITRETLRTHIARVLSKTECQSRSQLVAKYLFGE
jgi:DNA-binding CsgD family transcriptional regulator